MVGAVIVRDGHIIGTGWHRRYGDVHAEVDALRSCTASPQGATIYVTLEPCCHHGKQPPCTDALMAAGIARVVVGSTDPNPSVNGAGLAILRQHGIAVTEHVLEDECTAANEVFFHHIRTGLPLVMLKYAMTLDGKIASVSGDARWVTGESSRRRVHELRHRFASIMIGVGTVLADDPLLTCRRPGGANPLRIVCDSQLRTPLSSRLVSTAVEVPTLIVTATTDAAQLPAFHRRGCQVLECGGPDGRINLPRLMRILGDEGIDSVLLEGGGTLNWAALRAGIVNRFEAHISPKIVGGLHAPSPVHGPGIRAMSEAIELATATVSRLGDDIIIEGVM